MIEQTLMLIKPNAVRDGHIGDIISIIERDGFTIKKMKQMRFDENLAAKFYQEHLGKGFYERLLSFMCSGDSVALLLEKENAIAGLRELMGDVVPEKRKPGTIRALYGADVTENGVHGSDSPESAVREIGIVFVN
ncbi:MAG: nucleoside-diphosphate kinase [Candidatus Cloacimonetes bacterium]|nr:nucleoside-diphosphate kinase [Candidatus Cloacimonadota bacterium]NLO43408.1 nucleoside-diphosphate kinase [Candidatus Cloacimonadota bacterium]